MNHSDTLELSLQLLRQPSVTPVDHDCQNIMAQRLAKLASISKICVLMMSTIWARRGTEVLCSVLLGIPMLFQPVNWMLGIQIHFSKYS
jgi:predicted negative regulator of RcsB-dependent stress response